jgi:hypothetical protein
MPTVKSSFDIDSWDQDEIDRAGPYGLGKALVKKTFRGEIEGTSVTNILLGGVEGGGMAYCGFERFDVTVGGRRGSFVLLHNATASADGGTTSWTILPGSGTGELEGIVGTGEIVRHDDGSHDFSLDYTLP